jgi:hypothetical protein
MATILIDVDAEIIESEPSVDESVRQSIHLRMFLFMGLVLAVLVRLGLVLSSNFPLNDGGMFDVMIRDLHGSHFALPHFTTYNDKQIPYAYPPLANYVSDFLATVIHIISIKLLRVLPLVLNIAAIGAFALLARSVLRSQDAVAVSVVAFCFLPNSVMWFVMGGGLTRGFGFLFALLALHQGYELFTRRTSWRIAPTAVFAALTVLSHPEMAWFLAYSLGLIVFWYGRNRHGLIASSVVVSATAALTAPWWLSVVAVHGIDPFLASVHTGSMPWNAIFISVLRFDISGEPFFPVIALIAIVGILAAIRSQRWFLIVWLAIVMPLDSREYLTDALVPVALLAGIAFVEVVVPWLTRMEYTRASVRKRWLRSLGIFGIPVFLALALFISSSSVDVPLSKPDRDAMAWVAQETSSSSQFVVLSGSSSWWTDRQSEWFPDLSGRTSVATVQGSEWLTTRPFSVSASEYRDLQHCTDQSSSCLDAWASRTGASFDYVYVSTMVPIGGANGAHAGVDSAHHFAIEYALKSDPDYTLVFENSGAAIFKRN